MVQYAHRRAGKHVIVLLLDTSTDHISQYTVNDIDDGTGDKS